MNYLSSPNSVIWDITNRCNLRCRHCYVEADSSQKEGPSKEEALSIMDQLRKAKVFRLSFSGGEPLLRKDLFDLLQYASKYFSVEVASNGLLITEENARKLKSARIGCIQLSLDGLEGSHDYLRGRKGAFQKLMEAVTLLKREGIPFGFTSVVYEKNFSQTREIIELAEDLGAFTVRFYRLIHTGRGGEISPLDITASQYKETLKDILTYTGRIHAVADEAFGFLISGKVNPHQWVGCQAGRTLAGIKASGHVVPCPMFEDPVFFCGKVPEEDFAEIWKTSPVLARFRQLDADTLHGKCSHCQYLSQCGGGCRAAVYARTHDLYSSDYQCFVEESE